MQMAVIEATRSLANCPRPTRPNSARRRSRGRPHDQLAARQRTGEALSGGRLGARCGSGATALTVPGSASPLPMATPRFPSATVTATKSTPPTARLEEKGLVSRRHVADSSLPGDVEFPIIPGSSACNPPSSSRSRSSPIRRLRASSPQPRRKAGWCQRLSGRVQGSLGRVSRTSRAEGRAPTMRPPRPIRSHVAGSGTAVRRMSLPTEPPSALKS